MKEKLAQVIDRELAEQAVSRRSRSDLQVYQKFVFVTASDFAKQWQPPHTMGIQTTSLLGLQGSEQEGVIFQRHEFPKDVPHWVVKLSFSKMVELQSTILSAGDVVRSGQAKDTFYVKLSKELALRDPALRGSPGALSALSCADADTKFKAAQEEFASKTAQLNLQNMGTDLAVGAGRSWQQVTRISHSMLSEEEDEDGGSHTGPGRGRKQKPAAKPGAAGKRTRQLTPPSSARSARCRQSGALGCVAPASGSGTRAQAQSKAAVMSMDTPTTPGKKRQIEEFTPEDFAAVLRGEDSKIGLYRCGVGALLT